MSQANVAFSSRTNEYANCMFRDAALPEAWINQCVSYLTKLFGPTPLAGKTVVDYAFGRGNWSLAFLKLGAAKVIAIDASQDNVIRFSNYCQENQISRIEIIQANILLDELNIKADLIWLYGILHHIEALDIFLERIKGLLKDRQSWLYLYFYNAGSLRQFTVETCRNILVYKDENSFLDDAPLYLRPARLRAQDDLTAPFIAWKTGINLQQVLIKHGIYIKRQDPDFNEFLNGIASKEFYPHQFLCDLSCDNSLSLKESPVPYQTELLILREMAEVVFAGYVNNAKKVAIGLFNTHFSFLELNADKVVIELFLYLARLLHANNSAKKLAESRLPLADYLKLIERSIAGLERENYQTLLGNNLITDYLCRNRVRL